MNNRTKATTLFSLLILRKPLFAVLAAEIIICFVLVLYGSLGYNQGIRMVYGNDVIIMIFVLLAGMSIYRDHTSFCREYSVKKGTRVGTLITAVAVYAIIAAAIDCLARTGAAAILDVLCKDWYAGEPMNSCAHYSASFPSLIKTFVSVDNRRIKLPAEIMLQSAFFTGTASFGMFIYAAYKRFGVKAAVVYVLFTAVYTAAAVADISIPAVVFRIPAQMFKNALTAVVLCLCVSAVFMTAAVLVSEIRRKET